MLKKMHYQGYDLNYYFKPGTWASSSEIQELDKKINKVNQDSGKNFSYGIFDLKNKDDFYNNSMICVLELDNEPAGFFYNVIIQKDGFNIVHQGLVLISKNIGQNLLFYPYLQSNILIKDQIGDFYITSISSVPSIIGEIYNIFDDVWPSPYANLIKPQNSKYGKVAEFVFDNYVKKYFPFPSELSFSKKRFVVESSAKEMGFERDIRNMARDARLEVNLFCQYWLDYSKNEDIIQVGYFDDKTVLKNKGIL